MKITAFFAPAIALTIALFTSCKKDADGNHPHMSKIDTTKQVVDVSDTGSKTIGATLVAAMVTGAIANTSFTPAAPVNLSDQHDIVISGIDVSRISLLKCQNITIRNCRIGPNKQSGINLVECSNITIDSCYLYQVSTGVFAGYSQGISITNCQAKNMVGPFPEGQFVKFNNVSGGGNQIAFNKFENILGESYTEDAISMYQSNGLPADPVLIESNWIKGGGPSASGGGIMLGDGGGSYITAKDNFLVDAGQYGMAVAGGSYMSIVNNSIYAKAQPFTSVGLYYRNYSKLPSANIAIAKNAVNFTNSKNVVSTVYLGPGELAPWGWDTNAYSAGLTETTLPESIVSESVFPPSNVILAKHRREPGILHR